MNKQKQQIIQKYKQKKQLAIYQFKILPKSPKSFK